MILTDEHLRKLRDIPNWEENPKDVVNGNKIKRNNRLAKKFLADAKKQMGNKGKERLTHIQRCISAPTLWESMIRAKGLFST